MPALIEGMLNASGKKFALVASRFNELITRKLVEGAIDCIVRHGGSESDITLIWVPGAFETPLAVARVAAQKKFDGIIALGAVIRGATPHFDYVAAEATKGIAKVALDSGVPVGFGILTTDSIEQAVERAGTKSGNKGWDAALSTIEMVQLYTQL
jgi:6,7-dimethyl-8-ribityllumazine synthase